MSQAKEVKVVTQEDVFSFIDQSLKNVKQFENFAVEFDKKAFTLKLFLKGERYDQTITTPVMRYVLDIQQGLYNVYRQYAGHALTAEEKKELEIVVKVEKGSSVSIIDLFSQSNFLQEAVKQMTGNQTFAVIITGIAVYGLIAISKKVIDHLDRRHERDIELQKANAQTEKDKFLIEQMQKTVETVSHDRRKALNSLSGTWDSTEFQVNGETVNPDDLHKRALSGRDMTKTETATETGLFKITRLLMDFNNSTAKADMYNITTDEVFTGMLIQNRSIIDGAYTILKTAQNKDPVNMQIITTRKKGILRKVTFDRLL